MAGIFEDIGSGIKSAVDFILPGESGGMPVDSGSGGGIDTTTTEAPAQESWWDSLGTFGQIALVAVGGYVVYRVVS